MATPIWPIEGVALDSTGDEVVGSLGVVVKAIQTTQTADSADITAIKAVTDVIPDAGAMTSIAQEATLVDVEAEVTEVEKHLHNQGRWWGAVAAPDETNAIEVNVTRPFSADSGADTWGTAIPILGTADNPVGGSDTLFDPHRILIVDTQHASAYRIRFIWGTGTSGDAITAEQWSEDMFFGNLGAPMGVSSEQIMKRILIGWKMWAQVWNVNNTSTVDFYWGAHGYVV